ncbi:MAG TPA: PKD domain-containing protein, partial [Anseongella sp.]|nr:PKD domain-containing protein [Anseongella sp.]
MNALVLRHRRSLILTLFLIGHLVVFGQPGAAFTATPVSGCSPLIVSFTDQSTGSPTQWRWDLGNGVISTLRNPSATYFNPGTYTVKLTVRNASGADSVVRQQYITVYDQPTVSFRASDTTGCFPMPIQFTDLSTAGSGTISTWQWDFGDGTISTERNPTHVYTAAGNFTVTLKVTNSNGCVKSFSRNQHIKIATGVSAAFSNSAAGPCAAPATIQFTNSSTGPGAMTYIWNFGDGQSSFDANPAHLYTVNGNYTVSLTAISEQGCRDTVVKTDLLAIGTI